MYSKISTKPIFIILLCVWLHWTRKTKSIPELQWSGITSERVLVIASGSTTIQVAWWTEHAFQVVMYSVSCNVFPAKRSNSQMDSPTVITVATHVQNITIFADQSINTARIRQLIPLTRYRCCLIEHNFNNTLTAEVCKQAITQIDPTTHVSDTNIQTDCPTGSTVSLFVMMLLALFFTSLLLIVFMKQGKDAEKIAHWYNFIKIQTESPTQVEGDVIMNNSEAVADCDHNSLNSVAADNAEEETSHFPIAIVTTECVAYHCTTDTDRVTSVVYDVPFAH